MPGRRLVIAVAGYVFSLPTIIGISRVPRLYHANPKNLMWGGAHQAKSSDEWWLPSFSPWSIIRRKNVRPGRTTLHAWFKRVVTRRFGVVLCQFRFLCWWGACELPVGPLGSGIPSPGSPGIRDTELANDHPDNGTVQGSHLKRTVVCGQKCSILSSTVVYVIWSYPKMGVMWPLGREAIFQV